MATALRACVLFPATDGEVEAQSTLALTRDGAPPEQARAGFATRRDTTCATDTATSNKSSLPARGETRPMFRRARFHVLARRVRGVAARLGARLTVPDR